MVDNQESRLNFSMETLGLNRRRGSGGVNDMEEEEKEEVPTHLNTINSSGGFLVVSPDKLSVKYTNVHLHGHDVGVVQANCPAPSKRLVYYFEIFVKDAGTKGQIAIGFTNEHFKMRRQPGWDPNSYGYHGDDGLLYRGQGKGESFGPTFTSGDTVGGDDCVDDVVYCCAVDVLCSKNGKLVGPVCKDVKGPLFPTIAVHSQNEEVNINFGQHPFVFDVEALALEERLRQQMTIEKVLLPLNVSHGIVRSYLLHYGYHDTLNSFDMASKSTLPPVAVIQENGFSEQGNMYALNHRKVLRQNDTSTICFLLHCQKFIELVQVRELEEAVKYARAELAKFFEVASLAGLVQECIALLAYEEPSESPVGYLLDMAQREVAADAVNIMILLMNPDIKDPQSCTQSHLEKLLRQLTACCLERRAISGDQGEAFNLQRVLQSSKGRKW
ncbi:hypothetical protein IFM89_020217 [Coptis chinensis]|uniref:Uncharacterized protein n=1 Tax=Coptis chinensis TaxID=261450 RepID=A0A835LNE8_9MAGN|nr:hypothetical protein IFM89_020217 [Coptis chinensis]